MLAKIQPFVFNDVNLAERPYINSTKDQKARQAQDMGRLIKYLIYLMILGVLALTAYAYLGPFFGADFSAPLHEIRVPVTIDG